MECQQYRDYVAVGGDLPIESKEEDMHYVGKKLERYKDIRGEVLSYHKLHPH